MKIKKIFKYFFVIITFIILFLSIYIDKKFNNISFEQLIYTIFTSEGTSMSAIIGGIIFVLIGTIIAIFSFIILKKVILKIINKNKIHTYLSFKYKKKNLTIDLFKPTRRKNKYLLVVFLMIIIIISIKILGIDEYIKLQINRTSIFEDYYIDARDVKIKFPKEKKNLIYIYVESLEMTNASIENGGGVEKSYIPNLEKLALNEKNINFSNTSKLGGALPLVGTEWTAAAMISQTSGVPLKISIDSNCYYNYGDSLPGIYNLGDILKENGYNNYLFIGSDAEFGGRKDYFTYHGQYKIYDYNYAKKNKWISDDYYVWWGYEDKKLFEFAKKTLLDISKEDEPFNFTLLTADTHFVDGYMDDSCEKNFDKKYANSFNCSDSKLYDFISWIKKQDFYKDTIVILVGDHLTMQQNFYTELDSNYVRSIYNLFINSEASPFNKHNRLFSSFDLFPTTLAALGAEIGGDRLGLGTNLFSKKTTLIEELGYEYFNEELKKKSFFYDNNLLGDTYYEMKKEKN